MAKIMEERRAAAEKAVREKAKARRKEVAEAAAEARLAAQKRMAAEEDVGEIAAMADQEDLDGPFIDEDAWNASVDLAKQLDPELYEDDDGDEEVINNDFLSREKEEIEIENNNIDLTIAEPKRATVTKDVEEKAAEEAKIAEEKRLAAEKEAAEEKRENDNMAKIMEERRAAAEKAVREKAEARRKEVAEAAAEARLAAQ